MSHPVIVFYCEVIRKLPLRVLVDIAIPSVSVHPNYYIELYLRVKIYYIE